MSHAALGFNTQTGACPRWLWRLVRIFMFYDKHNNEIRVGDILRYQETDNDAEDYGKSLDEVVMHGGKICGIQRVGFPRWADLREVIKEPISLEHYASFGTNRVTCAEVIGNVREHPERMTPEHAWRVFPANHVLGDSHENLQEPAKIP